MSRKLAVLLTMKASCGAAAVAAAASVRASSTLFAEAVKSESRQQSKAQADRFCTHSTVMGFSISTCLPAARNFMPMSAWQAWAVQMITPSILAMTSLSAIMSSQEE
eukprot:COSAG04_NODE_1917_length_5225_cov_3.238393_6_plen_107_part_00